MANELNESKLSKNQETKLYARIIAILSEYIQEKEYTSNSNEVTKIIYAGDLLNVDNLVKKKTKEGEVYYEVK
jgi:hypothetical protein